MIHLAPPEYIGDDYTALAWAHPISGTETRNTWPSEDGRTEEWSWSRTYLVSVVGPMVGTVYRYEGYHGVGGWLGHFIQIEFLDEYQFDLATHLEATGQYDPAYAGWALDRFFVDRLDGDHVVLAVQKRGCDQNRSTCALEVERIAIIPPPEWWPWLRAAERGAGLLNRDVPTPNDH